MAQNEEQSIAEHEREQELKDAGKTRPRYTQDLDAIRDKQRPGK